MSFKDWTGAWILPGSIVCRCTDVSWEHIIGYARRVVTKSGRYVLQGRFEKEYAHASFLVLATDTDHADRYVYLLAADGTMFWSTYIEELEVVVGSHNGVRSSSGR